MRPVAIIVTILLASLSLIACGIAGSQTQQGSQLAVASTTPTASITETVLPTGNEGTSSPSNSTPIAEATAPLDATNDNNSPGYLEIQEDEFVKFVLLTVRDGRVTGTMQVVSASPNLDNPLISDSWEETQLILGSTDGTTSQLWLANGFVEGSGTSATGTITPQGLTLTYRTANGAGEFSEKFANATVRDYNRAVQDFNKRLAQKNGSSITSSPTDTPISMVDDSQSHRTFVGVYTDTVRFLEWTQSNGQVTGHLEETAVSGKDFAVVENNSIPFTGIMDPEHMQVLLTWSDSSGSTVYASGFIPHYGIGLSVYNSDSMEIYDFQDGTIDDYNAAVQKLEKDLAEGITLGVIDHEVTLTLKGPGAEAEVQAIMKGSDPALCRALYKVVRPSDLYIAKEASTLHVAGVYTTESYRLEVRDIERGNYAWRFCDNLKELAKQKGAGEYTGE